MRRPSRRAGCPMSGLRPWAGWRPGGDGDWRLGLLPQRLSAGRHWHSRGQHGASRLDERRIRERPQKGMDGGVHRPHAVSR